jgi:hypothetical protein
MATTSSLGGFLAKTLGGLTLLNTPVAAATPEYFKKSLLFIPFFDLTPIFHPSFGV